ncbi:MAG: Mth938-like domain-containing protein [Burkholderiaceae bacterium]|uniref:Mth938-like domain-containing protein n=1 Tax=Hylemonella sp. TaxID=2066020 RepID=UPI0035B0FFD4|nr:Mth938-like domain-containing protein [Burkholderiaceae bacterium]
MKLQPDKSSVQTIRGYGPGWIAVDAEKFSTSLVLGSRGERLVWDCSRYETLSAAHFAPLADLRPELVLFGSGERLRFPRPEWLRPLVERGIGLETMDTAAACRTYNILAGEGRHVVVALLLETP